MNYKQGTHHRAFVASRLRAIRNQTRYRRKRFAGLPKPGRWIYQPAQLPGACLQTNRDARSGTEPQVQPSWIASYLRESSPGLRYEPQMDPEYGRMVERQAPARPLRALPAYREYGLRRRHRRPQTALYGTDSERRGRSRYSEIEKSLSSRAVQWHPGQDSTGGPAALPGSSLEIGQSDSGPETLHRHPKSQWHPGQDSNL